MNKNITNKLHSFILFPLLFTNVMSTDATLINKEPVSETREEGGISLNFKIFNINQEDESSPIIADDRAAKIDAYFAQWNLPLAGHGSEMVAAADKYGLDWKLIPALAMLETTGGKNLCDGIRNGIQNKNPLGYGGCSIHFNTFADAFEAVAKTVSGNSEKTSHLYKDKSIPEILEVYNPPEVVGIMPDYHKKALKVMEDIASMPVTSSQLVKA